MKSDFIIFLMCSLIITQTLLEQSSQDGDFITGSQLDWLKPLPLLDTTSVPRFSNG